MGNEQFLNDLQSFYNHYKELRIGKITRLDLPQLPIQYRDFAIWQRNHIKGEYLKIQLSYWLDKLRDYQILNLPLDKPRSSHISYIGDNIYFKIDELISQNLRNLAKELNVSLYSLLLSGYYILLSCYSNQNDIVVGASIANRHYPQLETLVGFFVNTLALRSKINIDTCLVDYITEVGDDVIAAQLHQDLPFEKLVEALNIPKDTSRNPVFQIMFQAQNFGAINSQSFNNLLEPYYSDFESKVSKFDITTRINDGNIQLTGMFNYATNLFTKSSIQYLVKTYQHILEQLSNLDVHSQMRIKDLSYLNAQDYAKVITIWNQTDKSYPKNKTIHELFEEQVVNTPNNIAVAYETVVLTYRELNEQVNQLTNYLRKTCCIQINDLVALCLNRSEQMIVGQLRTSGNLCK